MIRIPLYWLALLVCIARVFPVFAQTDSTIRTLSGNGVPLPDDYPTMAAVATRFADTYGNQTEIVSFEKRPDGYWVVYTQPGLEEAFPLREQIWSRADGQWKALHLLPADSPGDPTPLIQNQFYYNRVPYYGYRGWYRDVIQLLEGKPNLPPDQEFSLATAWFERATALLADQYGSADSLETFHLPNSKNALDPAQLAQYLDYMNQALAHYEQWAKQWPQDETVVGPAAVKLANQYMTAFLQLQYFQNEKTALRILDRPPLSYNNFLLESARNLLRCCPQNAVLFTYGDNDTYPLLYVQAKQGFRRDVIVANLSLLFTGRYINFLRDSIFDAPPLQFQCTRAFYDQETSALVYLSRESNAISLGSLLDSLQMGRFPSAYGFPFLQANSIYFYANQKGCIQPKASRSGYRIDLPLGSAEYLRRDQLAILDLLYANLPERTLCFATTCPLDLLDPYKNHLRLQALVYRFDPKPVAVSSESPLAGTIDLEVSYRLFAEELEYRSKDPLSSDGMPYQSVQMYYSLFTALALAESRQNARAEKVLDRYLRAFPNERMFFGFWHLRFVELFEKIGKPQKALAIARKIVGNIEQGNLDLSYRSQVIQQIQELAQRQGDQALLARLEKLY